ncbi:MAG: SdpI family protein [Chthoniobacterales bacterium]|nr:SdpI family protein [Chthoniobacterales bacterium]
MKLRWLEVILLAAPFAVLAIYWNELPARVPMHWNLRGEIDAWGAKGIGLFLLPLISLGVTALLLYLPRIDPKLRAASGHEGRMPAILPIIRLTSIVLLDAIFAVQIAVSLGWKINSGQVLMSCLLVFLVVLGNYLGSLRPNYFAGIRTPWTLENPETWRATHRQGGRLMFFGGLILLGAQFFLSQETFGLLFTISISLLVVWVIFYSWHHSRTHASPRST